MRVSITPGGQRYLLTFILLNDILAYLFPQDQASSESVQNKIKIDEHSSRSVTDTEAKPTTVTSITSRKDLFELEDLAQLVCLALSDYAVWADVDLRRKIDWGNNQDHYVDDTELIHDKSIDDNNGCTSFHII